MIKLLADSNIPGLEKLSACCSVIKKPGRDIGAKDLEDVDGLLIRSVTKVDAALLQRANRLKFIGTATIGTDHVDEGLLASRGISFSHAPGCNANAVVDFVLASLIKIYGSLDALYAEQIAVGIVGCGNVGSRLQAALKVLNIQCKVYDPLKSNLGDAATLSDVLRCDVVTLHVPLVREGLHATLGMINPKQLASVQTAEHRTRWIINTSRGEVIDDTIFNQQNLAHYRFVVDVWHNEPCIDADLVERCRLASTHIAGYSAAGKLRGSYMIFNALAETFDIELPLSVSDSDLFLASCAPRDFSEVLASRRVTEYFSRLVTVEKDMQPLKDLAATTRSKRAMGLLFDCLRSRYALREETDYSYLLQQ